MIFSVPKSFLFLILGITFSVADIPASKRHLARFDESGLILNSMTHGHPHSLGEVRPVKEEAATAPNPAAHGHLYTPGMNRPVLAHPTESTPDSTTDSKILAARITTTETITVTNIPLVFKTITITTPYSQSSRAPTPLASTTVAAPEVSGLPDYRSITIMINQQSTVPPSSQTLTGQPLTLPPCNGLAAASDMTPVGCTMARSVTPEPTKTSSWTGSSQGSLWHVRAATTNQPLLWTGNSTPCVGNKSFECVVNGSSIITLGPISQILATGSHPTSGAGISGSGNHSRNWTSNSAPCAQNKIFECVVEGSSTMTLGLISEILGATTGKATSGISISSSGNHSRNWTSHSTPCSDNKSFECVDTGSGIITLGPIQSLNHLRPWTADSSPCAQNNSFECVINGSSTITLGLVASLTAFQPSTLSTNKGMLSTLSEIESLLTSFSSTTSTSSTKLPTVSMISGTSSWEKTPHSTAVSSMGGPSPCASNTSLECLVQGTSTFVVGTSGIPPQTPTPGSRTLVPCAQDTLSSCVVGGSHTLTVPPRPSNLTISSNFPTVSGTQNPHDPYPYPRAGNGGMKPNVPTFLLLLCSLVSIVTAQGFHGRSKGADLSSTSTNVNYGPLVSSLNALASSATGVPDGNWGIGVPHTTTPTLSQNSPYGGGTAASIATGFTAPQNPTFGGGGGGTNPAAAPTHADSGPGSSPSGFPSSFIVPVTGSGTEAPVETSSQSPALHPTILTTTSAAPTSSKSATSGSSKVKIPPFLLLLSHLASLAAGKITDPSPRVLIGSVFTLASSSPTLMTPNPPPTMAGASPSATLKPATSGASNIKIPFLLLLFCTLASLISAASTPSLLSLNETTFSSAPSTSGYSMTPAKSTTFTITAAQTKTTPSGPSNGASTAPLGPTPNPPTVCSPNTGLMCIVQGSSTFTVGTLEPQTTLTTTSAMVAATTGSLTASPSTPAKSGASSNVKLPFFLSFLATLMSLVQSASANDFPIPSNYAGAGNMNVHRETTSQGLRRIATPVLVLMLCCAIATLYSLGTGRKKLIRAENIGYNSGRAVQREEYVETVSEGEKIHLFEETCSVGSG